MQFFGRRLGISVRRLCELWLVIHLVLIVGNPACDMRFTAAFDPHRHSDAASIHAPTDAAANPSSVLLAATQPTCAASVGQHDPVVLPLELLIPPDWYHSIQPVVAGSIVLPSVPIASAILAAVDPPPVFSL